MKIKLIDLLNMRARNEVMPEKIKYEYYDYFWNDYGKDYQKGDGEMLLGNLKIVYHLNDEVEIIEEDKEIEKLGKIYDGFSDSYYDTCLIKIAQKVDEVIDALNKLKADD